LLPGSVGKWIRNHWKPILRSCWKVKLEGVFEGYHFKEPLENLVENTRLKGVAEVINSKLSLRRLFFGPIEGNNFS
jgi:hypothetical protein